MLPRWCNVDFSYWWTTGSRFESTLTDFTFSTICYSIHYQIFLPKCGRIQSKHLTKQLNIKCLTLGPNNGALAVLWFGFNESFQSLSLSNKGHNNTTYHKKQSSQFHTSVIFNILCNKVGYTTKYCLHYMRLNKHLNLIKLPSLKT